VKYVILIAGVRFFETQCCQSTKSNTIHLFEMNYLLPRY